MFVRSICLSLFVFLSPVPVLAQSGDGQTLADIRIELTALAEQILSLRTEIVTTGSSSPAIPDALPLLQRMDTFEAELRRLTGQVEALQNDIEQIVAEASNKIGDLEFRLVELEGGDVSTLGEVSILGSGGTVGGLGGSQTPGFGIEGQLAMSEQADFDSAYATFESGSYGESAEMFLEFVANYPDGPLTSEAAYWRGEALTELGDWNNAARSFLDSFSGDTQGARAPEALYRLGYSLGQLGQLEAACQTLGEVPRRFPNMDAELATQVDAQLLRLACPT